MKDRPDDAEGWIMLARSYTVLGRFSDALPAYRRATELQPKNPSLLADYADAIGATQGSIGNPESVALIERALAADPKHPKALALAGTVAYDRGDFTGAIARWQTLADVLPPDNELLKQVQASIAEAREHAGASTAGALPAPGPAATMATRPVAASPDSVSPATTGAAGASTAATSVSGSVALAPALAGRAAPGDTIFVFARAAEGGRMPLAVQRARVADLPLSFKLDDSMAMAPNAKLSGARSVIVSARISKSGNAMPQAGDLSGESAPVTPGTSGIEIRIDTVVGARQ
jgi:cytochrome c-type biogenesis protein CcmH